MTDVAQLAATVVDDPEVRAAVVRLTLDTLNEAREMMRRGRPEYKVAMIRTLLPALAKSLQNRGDDDDDTKALRAKYDELFEDVKNAGVAGG